MKIECSSTIFHVSSVESSITYYTNVLGFQVDFRYNDLAGVEYQTVLIYLSGPKQDTKRAIGQGGIYIFCDEVDQYFNDVCAKGASVEVPIDDRPYGTRDFAVTDPDGNFLTFGKSISV